MAHHKATLWFGSTLCALLLLVVQSQAVEPATQPTTTPTTEPTTQPTTKPAPKRGEIISIEGDKLTVIPMRPPRDNEAGGPVTYDLTDETRITVNTKLEEHKNDDGSITRRFATKPGTRADLKPGLLARVEADGKTATHIIVWPTPGV